MKQLTSLVFSLVWISSFLLAPGCRQPLPSGNGARPIELPLDPPTSDHQWMVVMDAVVLRGPDPNEPRVAEVKRDDYVRVLEIRDVPMEGAEQEFVNLTWYKIAIEHTGQIGWVNKDAIAFTTHSPYWSADTKDGDEVARRIFQDKMFFDKPISHVRVWSRYRLIVIWTDRTVPMPEDTAVEVLNRLNEQRTLFCAQPDETNPWTSLCTSDWAQQGRWVLIGWDEKGLYRYFLPFSGRTAEPF